ncbi:MAG: ParB/RepB/Spo0J family partition protein [Candidatus Dormibacteraeota bacterium]|uniref:ParB/RepB/Spo0J family partition protein n=1 Tax=Candidatus Dormiibacter inghamiae TaxID=3127013 RepID=A0A934N6L4_9BACT|nr:ParB/RepB/Spo0J family partition protein [Candidatus Dormibacteraeota bacterium]MBJ7605718.1 ParB/RepB/Spo0J family partition protein [Candidatus Dormibacteraeota bacterium]
MTVTRRALGRGLEALIPTLPGGAGGEAGLPQLIELDQVRASPEQTRRHFDLPALTELAESIREHGLLQPVLVRQLPDGYQLIAGERRCRAARLAGLERVNAIVRRDCDGESSLLLGLIENLQRADLNPIEEARGIRRLIEHFGLTHEEAARRLGKNRVTVSQALRLLSAAPAVVSATAAGAITAGHGRALAGLPLEQQELGLRAVLAKRLSVRQAERWAQEHQLALRKSRLERRPMPVEPEVADALTRLRARWHDLVEVRGGLSGGEVVFTYRSQEGLEALVQALLS